MWTAVDVEVSWRSELTAEIDLVAAAGGLRALPRLAFDSGGGAPAATGADAEAAAPLGVWLLVSDGEALGGVRLGDEREPCEPPP